MAGKLPPVVGGNRMDREFFESGPQTGGDVVRSLLVDPHDDGVAALAVHGGDQRALVPAPDHRVGLPVALPAPFVGRPRPMFDADPVWDPALPGGASEAFLVLAVRPTQMLVQLSA